MSLGRRQALGEIVPVALEPVRVARRRPRRRRLEPADPASLRLVERMHAARCRPEEIAHPERMTVAVGDDVDLALEHVVGLLERMVMRVRDSSRLVVDHEHRVQLRVEPLVDEHLDGDAAVGERCGRHARRDGRRPDRGAALQSVDVHLAVREQEEIAVARVADVERRCLGLRGRPEKERVAPIGARTRCDHLHPERAPVATPRMGNADGHDAARTWLELDPTPIEVEHRAALRARRSSPRTSGGAC